MQLITKHAYLTSHENITNLHQLPIKSFMHPDVFMLNDWPLVNYTIIGPICSMRTNYNTRNTMVICAT